jgi:hypothetical protein
MKNTNIFITHSPFQIFVSEQIIRNIKKFSHEENFLLIEYDYDYKYLDKYIWSDIIFLDNVGGNTFGRDKYLKCENNYNKIISLVSSFDNINVFFSDIAWPMNNRLFFDSVLQKKVQYYLISDGLGLYTSPKVTISLFCRGFLKSINGWLKIGVKYRNYLGSVFGLERSEIKKIYAPCAKLLNCQSDKKVDIHLNSFSQKTIFDRQKCIFIDQPYWVLIDAENWKEIRSKAINYVKSLGISNLFYKNHHRGRVEEANHFKSHGFCLINDKRCIEEIVIEQGYGTVISYDSSALFNLKATYRDDIRCIALFISKKSGFNENVSEKVLSLFNLVGVEVIRVI